MKGIIINWIGTLASIPADWLLCDGANSTPNLLGKYLLSVGTSENPGTTGGSATHTHTSPAHGHTQDSHSHTGNTGEPNGGGGCVSGSLYVATMYHTHPYTTSSTVATNQTTADVISVSSNDPAYYKVAPIIDSSLAGVKYPSSSLIFWGQSTLPNGWSACDGSGGTPDLRNKFLKCVDAAENPGSTGGSATHTHSPNSHTHTQNAHTHDGGTTGTTSSQNGTANWTTSTNMATTDHTHDVSVSSNVATNQNADVALDTINGEPTFKKLLILKNTGIANRPKYAIVLWTGTLANIPLGYVLCDGTNGTPDLRDYFVKGANDSSEIGTTGGSAVHGHTANSHNHTQDTHYHTISTGLSSTHITHYNGAGSPTYTGVHVNVDVNSNAVAATNQAATITVDNCSSQANYPPYYKVAYIMQDRELDVGAYAFMVN